MDLGVQVRYRYLTVTRDGVSERHVVPKSLKFLRYIKLPKPAYSLCPSSELACCFVGMEDGNVSQINEEYAVNNEIARMSSHVNGLFHHHLTSSLYGLVCEGTNRFSLECFNLNAGAGRASVEGYHAYGGTNLLKVIRSQDTLIVPQPERQILCVYNMCFELLRTISIPSLANNDISLAACSDNLAVVTDEKTVFLVNLSRGDIVWKVSDLHGPGAVAFYRDGVIMVADSKRKLIALDVSTGIFSVNILVLCLSLDTFVVT